MKKKLLLLMALALIGWSNVWAEDSVWKFYTWNATDGSKSITMQTTENGNIFKIVGTTAIPTIASKYAVYKGDWDETWRGACDITNESNFGVDKDLGSSDESVHLTLGYGAYNITFDASNHTIKFEYQSITINEGSTEEPSYTGGYYNFYTDRTLTANIWQTLCLPVWIDSENIAWLFGAETKVAEFTGEEDNSLTFSTVTSIDANKPYLIYPTDPKTLSISGTWVETFNPTEVEYGNFEFIGTNAQKKLAVGTYYVAEGKIHQVQTPNKTNIKATRAYFREKNTNLAREMRFVIDGEVTSIDQIEIPEEENVTGDIYNLNGQRMDKPFESLPAGVYIVSGKKLIKK